MKKLIISLMMAALMASGLVATTSAPSSAIDCNTYPGCVVGKLRVNKISRILYGQRNTIRVRITTPGTKVPTGTIKLRYKRKGGGNSFTFPDRAYTGQPLFYRTPKLTVPGRYKIIAEYIGNAPFSDLKNAKKTFVVKEKRFKS